MAVAKMVLIAGTLAIAQMSAGQADPQQVAELEGLRQEDARIARVAWKLASANVERCDDRVALTGLVLYDAAQFSGAYRAAADAAFGVTRGTVIAAVVPGSAGDRAGLRAGDVLAAIEGNIVPVQQAQRRASFDGVERTLATLATALAQGPARLGVVRGGAAREHVLPPIAGCASFVQLVPSTERNASADGRVVTITTAIAAFAQTDDELAAVIAHEMAHNILRHRVRLDAEKVSRGLFAGLGRNGRRMRAVEEEADRLSIPLMRMAGYDPAAALRFWERIGRATAPIIGDGTHAGWRTRVGIMAEEIVRSMPARS